jgi:excisionase family DNA binding protein
MSYKSFEEKLSKFEEILQIDRTEPLSFDEACNFLNLSKSYLYKLTCKNQIPFYKPSGKKLVFEKSELKRWLFRNKSITESDLQDRSNEYLASRKERVSA